MSEIKFQYPDKYVSQVSDIPETAHWAIIENRSYTIPGDERSRTCPGHGYPESTEHYVSYEVYLTEEKWKSQIAYRETQKSGKSYKAIKVLPAHLSVKVEVSVDVTTDYRN